MEWRDKSSISGRLGSIIGLLFLLSLWIYQLPVSPVERALVKVLHPLQQLMFTNRQYRMYAPETRAQKDVPELFVVTPQGEEPLDRPPGAEGMMTFLSKEKWRNFIDHLQRSLLDEWPNYPPVEGRTVFQKLSRRVCEARLDAARVVLRRRPVDFGVFQEAAQWGEPEDVAVFDCGGGR